MFLLPTTFKFLDQPIFQIKRGWCDNGQIPESLSLSLSESDSQHEYHSFILFCIS